MSNLKLLEGMRKSHGEIVYEMAYRINEIVYEYVGEVPLATAVGILEIVKQELINDHD